MLSQSYIKKFSLFQNRRLSFCLLRFTRKPSYKIVYTFLLVILETLIDDSEFLLINFFNANTESEQVQTFNELTLKAYNFLVILSYTLLMQMTLPFFKKREISK